MYFLKGVISMSGKDIDLCDNFELVSYIAKETEVVCATVSDCSICPCRYDDNDDIYHCRKEHLIKRTEELLPFYDSREPLKCN